MPNPSMSANPKPKSRSVRHTRAIQRDRTKRPLAAPPDEHLEGRLAELIHPATLAQVAQYHALGLRDRTLTLPIMVALVVSLIWRQVGAVADLMRLLHTEGVLWTGQLKVSQQAVSERLRTLPADLFRQVLETVLPQMQTRWQTRQRPLPAEIAWAQAHYSEVLVHDGSTLDALLRQVGLLRDQAAHPLAGRMTALLDLGSRLPRRLWYEDDATAHDTRAWPPVLGALRAGALLIFDLGYIDFGVYARLTIQSVTFITRAKRNLVYQTERVVQRPASVHEQIVWIGRGDDRQLVRLIEVLYHGKWYRYLTNELDTARLPAPYGVALYYQRWRIEDAYAIVKRLLGLAYFWSGAQNVVELQVWATWLLYAVLVDLTDAVAEALEAPFAAVSLEMVYRSLYYFTQAYHRGEVSDVVAYLAANAKLFGILKRKRKSKPSPLDSLTLTFPSGP